MKELVLSFLLVFASAAHADWTTDEERMFIASTIAIVADWATTRDITRRYDEGYYEKNNILGPYPSRDRVDIYFISLLAANYYFSDYLGKYKIYYLAYRTGLHGNAAVNNLHIGLRLGF